jgi:hypothetical protein
MLRKRSTWLLSVTLMLVLASGISYAANSKAGTYAYSFLKIPVGAQVPAMGGSAAALTTEVTSMYYNPAGITGIDSKALHASYNNYVAGIQAGYLAYVVPWGSDMRIGMSVNYLNFGSIPKTNVDGTRNGDFGGGDMALGVTIARLWPAGTGDSWDVNGDLYDEDGSGPVSSGWSAGLTAKFIYETLDDYSSDALALDVGILYGLNDNRTAIGASVSNLGFQLKSLSSGHKDEIPVVARAGFSHQLKASPFQFVGDVVKPIDNDPYLTVGVNFSSLDPVELRAGYSTLGKDLKTSSDKDGYAGVAVGIGLKLEKFDFDYAYTPKADIGNSHRIAISTGW